MIFDDFTSRHLPLSKGSKFPQMASPEGHRFEVMLQLLRHQEVP